MFGFTLRTNFNDMRPHYNDNARPAYQPEPQDAILQHSVVANQLTLLKYNAGTADQNSGERRYAVRHRRAGEIPRLA